MAIQEHPEFLPAEISSGYKMKEIRISKKLNLKIRRVVIAGVNYTIRPSFAMPYMTGFVKDVEKPMFLRKFAVPFWALSMVIGLASYALIWGKIPIADIKSFMELIFTPLVALVGSAIGFYYGGKNAG